MLSGLPADIQFKILGEMLGECQDVVSTVKAMPTFPAFIKEQWDTLKDTIDCRAFDDLKLVETITEDNGQYTRVETFYPRNQEGVDPGVRDAANDFATKCLFRRLYNAYEGVGMKRQWYSALLEWWRETKTVMVPKKMRNAFSYILQL